VAFRGGEALEVPCSVGLSTLLELV
jgi:hypothetical protein